MVAFAQAKSRRPLTDAQRQTVEDNVGLAYKAAGEVHRRLPAFVEFADVVQAALEGLMHAARGFDPQRGIAFSTYAFLVCRRHAGRYAKRSARNSHVWGQMPKKLPVDAAVARSRPDGLEAAEAWAALDRLPPRERSVVLQRLDKTKFREIGDGIGLTPQRAQQIHDQALAKLRGILEDVV